MDEGTKREATLYRIMQFLADKLDADPSLQSTFKEGKPVNFVVSNKTEPAAGYSIIIEPIHGGQHGQASAQ